MLSIIATYSAPVPLHGRELTAGWQAYMNQGLQTGAAYAGTGASGEGSFDDLNAQTADAFSALNHQGEPAAAAASPSAASASTAASPASTIGTDVTSAVATPIVSSTDAFTAGIISVVDSLTAALGSPAASSAAPASAAAPASPSSSGAASAPHFAGWQAYMNQGIATGLQYANAGAGVAAGTTDPATGFNDLNAETADSFNALNQIHNIQALQQQQQSQQNTLNHVHHPPRWQQGAAHGTGHVSKEQRDGRAGPRHAVDGGLALIGRLAVWGLDGRAGGLARVLHEDADVGLALLPLDQPALDGKGAHADRHSPGQAQAEA